MYTNEQIVEMLQNLPEWCKEILVLEVANPVPKPRQPTAETAQNAEKQAARPSRRKREVDEPPKSKFFGDSYEKRRFVRYESSIRMKFVFVPF